MRARRRLLRLVALVVGVLSGCSEPAQPPHQHDAGDTDDVHDEATDVGDSTKEPADTDPSRKQDGGAKLADARAPDAKVAPRQDAAQAGTNDARASDARVPDQDAKDASAPGASVGAEDLIVAPDGVASAEGTVDAPTTLLAALTRVAPGRAIYLRAGTYTSAAQITIARDNSGQADQRKQLRAYMDERPVLDFSSQPYGSASNPRGLQIDGSYWHVLGLTVRGSADNGIYVAGSHNIVENCVTHDNRDTGLQIGRSGSSVERADWPADNLILHCESYDNYDAPPGGGENADGFAAKLTVGSGNVFRGCVAHHNIDDGWDLYTKTDTGAIGEVTIDQCIAHHNGTLTTGESNASGDRNGFKLGGEKIAVAHVVTRSIAFANGKNGFTWNSNPGALRLVNNLAFDNVAGNYKFGDNSTQTSAVFTNNVSFWNNESSAPKDVHMGMDMGQSNCWANGTSSTGDCTSAGLTVSAADFASPVANVKVTRGADGAPDLSVFGLASGSDLINAGVSPSGTLPFAATYYQGKPDLGAVESN